MATGGEARPSRLAPCIDLCPDAGWVSAPSGIRAKFNLQRNALRPQAQILRRWKELTKYVCNLFLRALD
eukprot:1817588-Lingulodinium_polyedra.AAC.1